MTYDRMVRVCELLAKRELLERIITDPERMTHGDPCRLERIALEFINERLWDFLRAEEQP